MRLLFAPGDRGQVSDPVPVAVHKAGVAAGWSVDCLSDPNPGGDADDALLAILSTALPGDLVGGVSRGARLAVRAAEQVPVRGLLLFSYPFHARHDPTPGERVAWLRACPAPVFLVQGTRDAMGNREQVRGYDLPETLHVHWVEQGNHNLQPRARTGLTQHQALEQACEAAVRWAAAL